MNLKILVVDDNIMMQRAISDFLRAAETGDIKFGKIDTVTTLDDAIKLLNSLTNVEERYDCLILDWIIPEVNMSEWIHILRKKTPFSGIIVVSGYEERDILINCIESGADDFVSKLEMAKELAPRIAEVVTFKTRRIDRIIEGHYKRLKFGEQA